MKGNVVAAALIALSLSTVSAEELRYSASTDADYEDVVDDVKFAITEHNFRITGGNNIGGAIAKRHDIEFPRSEIVHFCNLEYARQFLEAAPDYVLQMPCKVVVYERDGRVVVEARMLPGDDARVTELTTKINGILKTVVDSATEN